MRALALFSVRGLENLSRGGGRLAGAVHAASDVGARLSTIETRAAAIARRTDAGEGGRPTPAASHGSEAPVTRARLTVVAVCRSRQRPAVKPEIVPRETPTSLASSVLDTPAIDCSSATRAASE